MNHKDHILQLIADAKISDKTAADAMGIKPQTFADNKSDSRKRNNFTEKNYNDLRAYLVGHGDKLMKLLQDTAMTNSELGKTK